MGTTKKICELEQRIFDYKLKELTAWRRHAFILEVNGKPVCQRADKTLVLMNNPFPTEFSTVEMFRVKNIITGREPEVIPVRDWYRKKLMQLTQILLMNRGEAV